MTQFKAFLIEEAEEGVTSGYKDLEITDLDPG